MQRERLLVITSYPLKNSQKHLGGLSWYAKQTLIRLTDQYDIQVLAEIQNHSEKYAEDNIIVNRIWSKDGIRKYIQLTSELIRKRRDYSKLMIQFEFGIYGNEYVTGLFPSINLLSRLLGYKILHVQHHVLDDLSQLSPHIGYKPQSMIIKIKGKVMSLFLRTLLLPVHQIVVFDEVHKQKLLTKIPKKPINVIPLAVEKRSARQEREHSTQRFKLLTFGFVAWYKGSDWIVKAYNEYVSKAETDLQLVVAGGESPTQTGKPGYSQFWNEFQNLLARSKSVEWTGFVPEEKIEETFQTCDIVILPYRVLMSSSGPLSLALSYNKPFMLSEQLEPYTHTQDFKQLLEEIGVEKEWFVFSLEDDSIFKKIELIKANQEIYDKLALLSARLSRKRNWDSIIKQYQKLLTEL